MAKIGKKF